MGGDMTYSTRSLWGAAAAVLVPIALVFLAGCDDDSKNPVDGGNNNPPITREPIKQYVYTVVNEFPHDQYAYTEGLEFRDGFLYEGTGQEENSSLRRVDLTTGEVLQMRRLPARPGGGYYFGEGITILGDRIYQQTWLDSIGFVYDRESFDSVGQFRINAKAWGLANDGSRMIMSTRNEYLYYCDTLTHQVMDSVRVRDNDGVVDSLNELEYINGEIWANIWTTPTVVMINPANGLVTGYLDLTGLLGSEYYDGNRNRAPNGIAYDSASGRIFVTGKYWPKLFELQVHELVVDSAQAEQ